MAITLEQDRKLKELLGYITDVSSQNNIQTFIQSVQGESN